MTIAFTILRKVAAVFRADKIFSLDLSPSWATIEETYTFVLNIC